MPKVAVHRITWLNSKAFATDVVRAFRGCGLSLASAMLLAAHAALSTGWGGKNKGGLPNYMLAGVKATSEQQDYIELGGFEIVKGERREGMMRWRAFGSLDESAGAMLALLKQKRYASAYKLLVAGDATYFEEVGRCGWYTADPTSTGRQMRSCLAQIQKWLGSSTPAASTIVVALALAAGAALYWLGVR